MTDDGKQAETAHDDGVTEQVPLPEEHPAIARTATAPTAATVRLVCFIRLPLRWAWGRIFGRCAS